MLERIENALMALFATCALCLVCYEVVVRYYFPKFLTDYGLELTIYFTVWAIFIAGAPLVREGRHVRADLLLHMLPAQAQRWLEVLSLLVGLAFIGLLTYFGWRMVHQAFTLGEKSESSLRMPLYLYYASLPVGTTLMIWPFIKRIYDYVFHFDPATMTVTDEHVARDK
ncbi:MAG TPA: TRAP transporter small permease [Hyphomicrobiaceae bacterium]|nr:TRAP transporter small permease [Hyphomicrobiaceae bacterium]